MKKILSIFALLLTIVTGAWAYEGASGDVSFIKINSGGKANKMADGCYYYRPSSGYSWSDGKGVKTQSNASSAVFYLSGETNVTIDLGHYESKNAHTVTASVYSLTETQYAAFYDITSESTVSFTLPNTPTTTFTVEIAASTETFTGTKKLASGYYAIVVAGEKGNTYFSGMHFASAATYSVTYKANNGTTDEDVVDETASTFGACSGTWTVPEGKGFTGWNTAADGTGDAYAVGASVTSNTTVYAQWANIYTQFSMTDITGPTEAVASQAKADVTATFSTGASAEVFNGHGSNDATFVDGNGVMNMNSSGGSYLHITLPSPLQAGDVITLGDMTGACKVGKTTSSSGASTKEFPYTLTTSDALIGVTDVYFFKDGSLTFNSLTITGAKQASDLAVTSSATPVVAIDATSDIEISTSSTGDVTYTSSDTSVATVSATGVITGVDGGTATITINQDADSDYRAGGATVTVTVPSKALLKIITLGGSSTKTSGTASFTADVNLSSNKKMDKGKYAGFTLDGENTIQTGDVIEVGIKTAQTGANGVFVFYDSKGENPNVLYNTGVRADEAKAYKFIAPATMNGATTVYLRRGDDNSGINEGWNPEINYIAVYRPDAFVTLNTAGFATYSSENDFEYAGADAYGMNLTATALTSTKETTGKVAAGEGILFKGEAGATVAIIETAGATAIADNSLLGTTMASGSTATPDYTANKYYALKGGTFKYYTGATFSANKAVFCVDKNTNLPNEFAISFDEATAIKGIAETEADAAAPVKVVKNGQLYIGNYNVAGQQVK